MVAFLKRMPYGIRGDVTRKSQSTIESQIMDGATPFPAFGMFGKIAAGKFVPIASGDAATDVYGILARPYPITGNNASDPLGTSVPIAKSVPGDVLRRGYINVKLSAGTAALGGKVYLRVTAASGKQVGDIEAAADANNSVIVAGAQFMSAADADGNVEIGFNI